MIHSTPRPDIRFIELRAMLRQLPSTFLAVWLRAEEKSSLLLSGHIRAEIAWRATLEA